MTFILHYFVYYKRDKHKKKLNVKEDGISIPYRYRSFVAPVQSYKLYSEVKRCKEYEHPYEAPYVVLLNNHCRIQEEEFLFEFTHPNKSGLVWNFFTFKKSLKWKLYFRVVLRKNRQ